MTSNLPKNLTCLIVRPAEPESGAATQPSPDSGWFGTVRPSHTENLGLLGLELLVGEDALGLEVPQALKLRDGIFL